MSRLRETAKLAREQVRRLRDARRGAAEPPSPFAAATLDDDDVRLIAALLDVPAPAQDLSPVERYEAEFAAWNGSRHARAFRSGRAALTACLLALGVGKGDEVVVPGYTCVVVPNACAYLGARVVYADIELQTYGLDVAALERALSPSTAAVVVQHLFGLVSRDYEAVVRLAAERGVPVIEDCAHAAGALLDGRRAGTRGDMAFFSSERSKAYSTGCGGVAVTDSDELGERLDLIAAAAPPPGQEWTQDLLLTMLLGYYEARRPHALARRAGLALRAARPRVASTTAGELRGLQPPDYFRRLAPSLAVLGGHQLAKLDRLNDARRAQAAVWDAWAERRGYGPPLVIPGSTPVYLRYPLLVAPELKADPDVLARELGFQPGVWFTTNTHPAPRDVRGCPRADEAVRRCINLPTLGAT